uniref:glycosyltransferase n=1 Tax=Actinotalea sp. TaxID=1872145 RepID=UPI00356639C7
MIDRLGPATVGEPQPEGWRLLRDTGSTYRDGAEEELFEIVSAAQDLRSQSDELLASAHDWATLYHLHPDRANIVRPLTIGATDRVLEIGAGCGAVTRYLGEVAGHVDALEPVVARARVAKARCRDLDTVDVLVGELDDLPLEELYDVVVVVGVLEYVGGGSSSPEPYAQFLEGISRRLVPGGTLVVAIENDLGVKYLCGAPEDHTNRPFDSLEGYPYGAHARTFSQRELREMLAATGYDSAFVGAFPDYKLTRALLDTPAMDPSTGLLERLPSFPSPDHLDRRARLADERLLWQTIVRAGQAEHHPNSFLVLAGKGAPSGLWPQGVAAQVYSLGRRSPFRTTTVVRNDADGTSFERRAVAAEPAPWLSPSTEAFAPGEDLLSWAVGASDADLAATLREWSALVERSAAVEGGCLLDLVPHNLIRRSDGTLAVVDQEFVHPSATPDQVLRRGLLWFASKVAAVSVPGRWPAASTVRDLAAHLGAMVGLDADGDWIDRAVAEEAAVQAEIRLVPGTVDDPLAVQVGDLQGVLAAQISENSLGERATAAVQRMQASYDDLLQELKRTQGIYGRTASELESAQSEVRRVERELELKQEVVVGLQGELESAATELHHVRSEAALASSAAAARLAEVEGSLAAIRSSRGYRLVLAWYRGVERAAPAGSRRRALYGRGGRLAVRAARRALGRPAAPAVAVEESLAIATSATPTVSVVIPIHGSWATTRQCLVSFTEHPPTVPYEIVVVDDASPDDSRARLGAVRGVRVVPLDVNRGFVGAVNAGIEACTGEYVALLNNDTQITDGWLEALLETAQEPGVGLVGSKLVYPDGRLQEAGGVLFSNADGWNFGRFDDPGLPRYNVRRDVDYCSGAAIMVRRDVLEDLGGLDETFAPAYYDDADLAFSIRERGLRVVYEPRAVVVHHEGVSHGTDVTSGIKRYQEINRSKMLKKWGVQLAQHYPQDPAIVQAAARRQGSRGVIVFIDDHVPRPDEDAGSVRTFAFLRALKRLGWHVVFVPDNRYGGDVWGDRLREEGIELFTGPEPVDHFLSSLRPQVRAVIGARVTVAWPYVGMVRRVLPGVPFLFDTVDLHHLREQREAELSGEPGDAAKAAATRRQELGFVMAADATIVVSPVEAELLGREMPEAPVCVIPTVHERRDGRAAPTGRRGKL